MIANMGKRLLRWLWILLVVAHGAASANAAVTVSPREFDLGNLQAGVGYAEIRADVTNIGTAEARLSLLEIGRTSPVSLGCHADGVYLLAVPPGASCQLIIVLTAATLAPTGTLGPGTASIEVRVNGDEQRIPLALRWNTVPDYLTLDEAPLDFGVVSLGAPVSVARVIRNQGPATLSFTWRASLSPAFSCTYLYLTAHIGHPSCYREQTSTVVSLHVRMHGCDSLPPGGACVVEIVFDPAAPFSMRGAFDLYYEAGGRTYWRHVEISGTGVAPRSVVGTVLTVEYYNPLLRHYFVTAHAHEQAELDAGGQGSWVRTGRSFWVHPPERVAEVGASPVCRYYGVPGVGPNSHFYSAIAEECEAVARLYPDSWRLESANVFGAVLPDFTGNCPAGTSALFRLWNNRADANHRYTTDPLMAGDMFGWVREGFGTQGVAMCVPQ